MGRFFINVSEKKSPRSDVYVFKGDLPVPSGGDTLHGIVPEFPAEMGGFHDTMAAAEHFVGICESCGVLAEFTVSFDFLIVLFHNCLLTHNSPVYPLYYI